jgi:SAM-dependent methyltransferase
LYRWVKSGQSQAEGAGSITEGIGIGRVTANLQNSPLDDAEHIPDPETVAMVYHLLREEGLFLGSASGVNVAGALRVARQLGRGHTIVTVLCDGGHKYQSRLFNRDRLAGKNLLDAADEYREVLNSAARSASTWRRARASRTLFDAMTMTPIYSPTTTEKLRQDFVLGLKLLANGAMQRRVRGAFVARIEPQARQRLGRAPARRAEIAAALARTPDFREWAALTHGSQSMMWRAVEATVSRSMSAAAERFAELLSRRNKAGSLELQPNFTVPEPISAVEIHRQPGGYVAERVPNDLGAGLRYQGSGLIYSPGKGNATGADARGAYIAGLIRERFPGFAPRRVLDLGCGIGLASQGLQRAFLPDEMVAIDVAAPLLRLAHLLAEEQAAPLHFKQRDATSTGFAAGSFDLIVSNIMFHETSARQVPLILRECRRLLAPSGVVFHLDVPTQVERLSLPDQVMNDWQVRWNGEPFWTGFAETDMRQALVAAGFDPAAVFAEHVSRPGGGFWYTFGARNGVVSVSR